MYNLISCIELVCVDYVEFSNILFKASYYIPSFYLSELSYIRCDNYLNNL